MGLLVGEAVSDAFKIFLLGIFLYSVFFVLLLRVSFYNTRSFARKNLRNLRKLKQFMEDQEAGRATEEITRGHELLNNIIARYRPRI